MATIDTAVQLIKLASALRSALTSALTHNARASGGTMLHYVVIRFRSR